MRPRAKSVYRRNPATPTHRTKSRGWRGNVSSDVFKKAFFFSNTGTRASRLRTACGENDFGFFPFCYLVSTPVSAHVAVRFVICVLGAAAS